MAPSKNLGKKAEKEKRVPNQRTNSSRLHGSCRDLDQANHRGSFAFFRGFAAGLALFAFVDGFVINHLILVIRIKRRVPSLHYFHECDTHEMGFLHPRPSGDGFGVTPGPSRVDQTCLSFKLLFPIPGPSTDRIIARDHRRHYCSTSRISRLNPAQKRERKNCIHLDEANVDIASQPLVSP
ncbi:hypothetical protein B0T19DRAFT_120066 [Cercophora scortea]|uniref:Uncharacterized protein n=1 Tax=Cercophora scortea TaxID=314031 RepID=A0AAE0IXP9_9PEZI|nr:hypothetical protein B0T19DRAFT_120066 [Cercophora scortea]